MRSVLKHLINRRLLHSRMFHSLRRMVGVDLGILADRRTSVFVEASQDSDFFRGAMEDEDCQWLMLQLKTIL